MNRPLLFVAIVNGVMFIVTGEGWDLFLALMLTWAAHAARASA